jgi:hypothetical protein
MKLVIETKFKNSSKTIDTLAVVLDTDEVASIANKKGLETANTAIDKFVARYTSDFKKKLAESLKS